MRKNRDSKSMAYAATAAGTKRTEDLELRQAREVAASLGGAVKNYALYPKDHSFARKYLSTIYRQLSSFLEKYDSLRLDIRKGCLLYGEETVYQGDVGDNGFASLFSRDGVQWLEFTRGIDRAELENFLDIIHTYRLVDEESEGDIITALWEGEYPHIQYKTVDIPSSGMQTFSLSDLRIAAGQDILPVTRGPADDGEETGDGTVEDGETGPMEENSGDEGDLSAAHSIDIAECYSGPPVSIALTAEKDLWYLTAQERDRLQTMVDEEEYGDNTDIVIETLLISLVVQRGEADFTAILDFLQDRYLHALKNGDFRISLKLLRNLRNLQEKYAVKKRWALPVLERFFSTVSQPLGLREIERFLTKPRNGFGDDRTEYLWAILRLLDPEILGVIGPLAGRIKDDNLRRDLFEVIIQHTRKSPETLAAVLDQCDEETVLKLIPIVELMPEADAGRILTGMALHSSVRIRKEAFRILSARDQLDPVKLFPLIDDADENIRQKMFFRLARKKDRRLEALFLDYLKTRDFKLNDTRHLLACYRTLGRCGSAASIPFLHSVLLDRNLSNMIGIGNSVHKEGAAMALHALRLTEATNILREGAKSIRPDVRFACRKAMAGKRGKNER